MTNTQNNQTSERVVLELIATDRLYIPVNSMGKKLDRARKELAGSIANIVGAEGFHGDRFYAEVVSEDREKARGMREGIEIFKAQYPSQGAVLEGMIRERRTVSERHLHFGMQPEKRLTSDDYLGVMQSLGFTEATARTMYPDLMKVSYALQKKRDFEQRSVMVGGDSGSESD